MDSLREWWRGRAERERAVLLVGGAALLLMLLYAFVWDPVRTEHERLRESLPALRAKAAQFEADVRDIERLGGRGGQARVPGGGPAAVESAAERAGIRARIKSIDEGPGARVQVTLDALPYDALVRWIADIASSAGLTVDSAEVRSGGAPGMVTVPAMVFKATGGA
jgi:general secretion pathway protein M